MHQAWRRHHREQSPYAARTEQETCGLDGITQKRLHEGCDQRHGAEQHDANDHHENAAGNEITILEHLEADERIIGRERMSEEIIKADAGYDRLDPYLVGVEPADLLTAVEQQLERADADGKCDEPEPVESHVLLSRRLAHEHGKADARGNSNRKIDEE